MGNNASSGAIETLPSLASKSHFAFEAFGDETDLDRLGPFGHNVYRGGRDLPLRQTPGHDLQGLNHHQNHGSNVHEATSWTLHSRMADSSNKTTNAASAAQVIRQRTSNHHHHATNSSNKGASSSGDNNSDYGSFDSESDSKMSSMNPKAAADELITDLDKLFAAEKTPADARVHGKARKPSEAPRASRHGQNADHRAYSTSPTGQAAKAIDGGQVFTAPSSRAANQFDGPRDGSRSALRQDDSIDGLEREAFAKAEPRPSDPLTKRQNSSHGDPDSRHTLSHQASGKLPSYDDQEQQLIDSIEAGYTGASSRPEQYY